MSEAPDLTPDDERALDRVAKDLVAEAGAWPLVTDRAAALRAWARLEQLATTGETLPARQRIRRRYAEGLRDVAIQAGASVRGANLTLRAIARPGVLIDG